MNIEEITKWLKENGYTFEISKQNESDSKLEIHCSGNVGI